MTTGLPSLRLQPMRRGNTAIRFTPDIEPQDWSIVAAIAGNGDLIYTQTAAFNGQFVLLDVSKCMRDPRLRASGRQVYSQFNGTSLDPVLERVTISELAKLPIRIHQASNIDPAFIYHHKEGNLLAVLAGEHISAAYDVVNGTVRVQPGITAPFYHVYLPAYRHKKVYVDCMRFKVGHVVGGLDLSSVDRGVRDFMAGEGLASMVMLMFFDPSRDLFKQVLCYHRVAEPSFEPVGLMCTCQTLREEFVVEARVLPPPSEPRSSFRRQL